MCGCCGIITTALAEGSGWSDGLQTEGSGADLVKGTDLACSLRPAGFPTEHGPGRGTCRRQSITVSLTSMLLCLPLSLPFFLKIHGKISSRENNNKQHFQSTSRLYPEVCAPPAAAGVWLPQGGGFTRARTGALSEPALCTWSPSGAGMVLCGLGALAGHRARASLSSAGHGAASGCWASCFAFSHPLWPQNAQLSPASGESKRKAVTLKMKLRSGWCGSGFEHRPLNQEVTGSIPGQDTGLGFRLIPSGGVWEAANQ